jgi:Flp pilus assembly protein TadD
LDRCHSLKLGAETAAALLAFIDMTDNNGPGVDREPAEAQADRLEVGLAWAVKWVIEHKRWDVLGAVERRYEDAIRHSRRLLYYLAAAVAQAGRADRAAILAEQAFTLSEDNETSEMDRVAIAKTVAELGRVDWAEREYRRVIEEEPVLDERSMEARSDLAMWLHDREEYQAAADVLSEFCDAVAADGVGRQRLIEEIELRASSGREALQNVEARRDFYLACVDEARGDFDRQRRRLKDAIGKYDKDPDILIAMYRSPGADEDFRQFTRVKIRGTAKYMQGLIDEYDDIPTFFNQWAWLIANTEGNQELAVEYSLRSLKLAPDEPSYLDTLGRCYYAVGDYANAVKYQRRAVKLAPQYQVMRRQLKLFKDALARTKPETADESTDSGSERDEADSDTAPVGPSK